MKIDVKMVKIIFLPVGVSISGSLDQMPSVFYNVYGRKHVLISEKYDMRVKHA